MASSVRFVTCGTVLCRLKLNHIQAQGTTVAENSKHVLTNLQKVSNYDLKSFFPI